MILCFGGAILHVHTPVTHNDCYRLQLAVQSAVGSEFTIDNGILKFTQITAWQRCSDRENVLRLR